jgi:hypothetical protein
LILFFANANVRALLRAQIMVHFRSSFLFMMILYSNRYWHGDSILDVSICEKISISLLIMFSVT